jgi:hypothetical protein
MSEHANGGSGSGDTPVIVLAEGEHVSSFLLRRIAEAADGFRGEEIFCRARFQPNNQFDFEVSAERDKTKLSPAGGGFGVFGPFFTPETPGPDLKDTPIASITVKLKDGRVIKVDPQKVDALFLTVSAVEKFAVPYYASKNSVPMAARVLQGFDQAGIVFLTHGPETEPKVQRLSDAVPLGDDGETPSEYYPFAGLHDPKAKQDGPTPGLQFTIR